jgi:hypothetical protein
MNKSDPTQLLGIPVETNLNILKQFTMTLLDFSVACQKRGFDVLR